MLFNRFYLIIFVKINFLRMGKSHIFNIVLPRFPKIGGVTFMRKLLCMSPTCRTLTVIFLCHYRLSFVCSLLHYLIQPRKPISRITSHIKDEKKAIPTRITTIRAIHLTTFMRYLLKRCDKAYLTNLNATIIARIRRRKATT